MTKFLKENKPYTYLIGWTSQNIWYYGVRYAANCSPSDLWLLYHTSSQRVKHFRDIFGEPDVVQVRRVFDNASKAIRWESRVLKRIGAVSSDNWLNRTDGRAIHPDDARRGALKKKPNRSPMPDWSRKSKSEIAIESESWQRLNTHEARAKAVATRQQIYDSMSDDERRELTSALASPEARQKAMETKAKKLESMSEEQKEELRLARSARTKLAQQKSSYIHSDDVSRNRKISKSKLEHNPSFTSTEICPHCGKSGQRASMKRWHFDKCKSLQ